MTNLQSENRLPSTMSTSALLNSYDLSKINSQPSFLPLKAFFQLKHQKPEPKQQKSKHYRSFEKLKTQMSASNTKEDSSSGSQTGKLTVVKMDAKAKIQENKIKLQKIKQGIFQSSFNLKGSSNLFRTENKMPNFKKQKTTSSAVIMKQIQQIIKPQNKGKCFSPNKKMSKSHLVAPKLKEYKTLIINKKKQDFQILKYIDEGSYGKVYLVQHVVTNMIFCLKVVDKTNLNDSSFNQLVRETAIQSSLNHPNVVNLYSYTSDAEYVYMLMEPCLGENLFKKMKKSALKQKEVRKYIKEVCTAVEYMHKNDIIHRDIKPQNILLHQNTVKICDFGWAVHSPLLRNTQCGTPLYTPPEMVKNEYYDSKIDVWCIGVLTYELLYGTIPFEIRHPNDLAKIVEQQVFFSKEINVTDSGKEFIKKCMAKNPYQRFTIRQALEHDFLVNKIENFRHTLA